VKRNLKYILISAGILLGALGGYLYYLHIGCVSGTCPITSQPLNSTMYGALMGGLLFSMLVPGKQSDTNNKKDKQS
jgi:hypothetical protein